MLTDRSNDDCYFYFYSTCTKGTKCPFRHCEAALGTEIVCSLWREGNCPRSNCKFRHMENRKNRHAIPCYWENQPGGCRKPHCVFYHVRPRHQAVGNIVENPASLILPLSDELKDEKIESKDMLCLDPCQPNDSELLVNASPVGQVIEPVVVSIDEESDTESTTSTPAKFTYSIDCHGIIQVSNNNPKVHSKKNKVKIMATEENDLGIKTLEQIRMEKVHRESAHIYNTEDQTIASGSNVTSCTEEQDITDSSYVVMGDLRNRLKRKYSNYMSQAENARDIPKKRILKLKKPTQDETVDSTGGGDSNATTEVTNNPTGKVKEEQSVKKVITKRILKRPTNSTRKNKNSTQDETVDSTGGGDSGLTTEITVNPVKEELPIKKIITKRILKRPISSSRRCQNPNLDFNNEGMMSRSNKSQKLDDDKNDVIDGITHDVENNEHSTVINSTACYNNPDVKGNSGRMKVESQTPINSETDSIHENLDANSAFKIPTKIENQNSFCPESEFNIECKIKKEKIDIDSSDKELLKNSSEESITNNITINEQPIVRTSEIKQEQSRRRSNSSVHVNDEFDDLLLDNDESDLMLYPEANIEKGSDELLQELEEIINS